MKSFLFSFSRAPIYYLLQLKYRNYDFLATIICDTVHWPVWRSSYEIMLYKKDMDITTQIFPMLLAI